MDFIIYNSYVAKKTDEKQIFFHNRFRVKRILIKYRIRITKIYSSSYTPFKSLITGWFHYCVHFKNTPCLEMVHSVFYVVCSSENLDETLYASTNDDNE